MATPNLGFITPVESQAQKTVTIANALSDIDKATQGDTPLVITGAKTVTAAEFTLGFSLELSGTPGAPFDLTVPSTKRFFRVENGSDDVATVKTASGTTVAVANGTFKILYCDGANITEEGGTAANTIHDNVSGEIAAITTKATPVAGDHVLIEDSAAGNVKKRAPFSAFGGGGGGAFVFQETVSASALVDVDLPLTTANAVAYEIIFAFKVDADGDGEELFGQITDDGFTTVESGATDYAWNSVRDATSTTNIQTNEDEVHLLLGTNLGGSGDEQCGGSLLITHPHDVNFRTAFLIDYHKHSSTPSINYESGGGFYMTESDIDGLRLFLSITSGTPDITGEFHIFALVAA